MNSIKINSAITSFLAISLVACSLVGCSFFDSNETTLVPTTATSVAPTATPSPTPTPTPTPTPLPTPTPTPVPEYVEPQYDEVWYNGFVDPRSVRAEIVTDPTDILCLVNKYHALPLDYVPEDLVDAPHSYGQQLREVANDAWCDMYDACLEATGEGLFWFLAIEMPTLNPIFSIDP